MKLEETENLKLQYLSKIDRTTSQENNTLDSDTWLAKKTFKHSNFKYLREKSKLWKKTIIHEMIQLLPLIWYNISECRRKQQDNQNKPQKHREPNKSLYQYIKKRPEFTQQKHSQ